MSRLQLALEQIAGVRQYTLSLLDEVNESDWFRMPPGGISHIGWQVGHLTIAEYRVVLVRTRGSRPEDAALVPDSFGPLFGRQSVPDPDATKYPPPAELRAVFERVHRQVLQEVPILPEHDLDAPLPDRKSTR